MFAHGVVDGFIPERGLPEWNLEGFNNEIAGSSSRKNVARVHRERRGLAWNRQHALASRLEKTGHVSPPWVFG